MKIAKFVFPVIVAGFVAGSAQAAILYNNTVDTSDPNWVVNTITVDTGIHDMTAFSAKVTLSSGIMNQEDYLGQGPHNQLFWFFPGTSGLDSYITMNDTAPSTFTGGGSLVGGSTNPAFNYTDLDMTWGNVFNGDTGAGQIIARLVFSPDANGTFALIGTDSSLLLGDSPFPADTLTAIVDGAIVPEPASLALLGLGGLAVLRRR